MWRSLQAMAAAALAFALLVGVLQSAAHAAKPRNSANFQAVRANPNFRRVFACNGGRYYTYLGGWGCDYYVYPRFYAPSR